MMTTSSITLYDVEFTLKEKTLSPYAVRLRLLLNYKNIPYDTVWLFYPDVEATAKAVGAPPTNIKADGNPGYTVPFVTISSRDGPTLALSDSDKIAEYIEETYPDPDYKLLPADTHVFQSIFLKYLDEKILRSMQKVFMPSVVRAMPAHTQEWFIESRKNTIGYSLEEIVPNDEAGIAEAWKTFYAAFDDLAVHLDKAGEENFRVTGDVSCAEFALVSLLNIVKQLIFEDGWKGLKDRNGGRWAKLMDLPLYKKLLPANRV